MPMRRQSFSKCDREEVKDFCINNPDESSDVLLDIVNGPEGIMHHRPISRSTLQRIRDEIKRDNEEKKVEERNFPIRYISVKTIRDNERIFKESRIPLARETLNNVSELIETLNHFSKVLDDENDPSVFIREILEEIGEKTKGFVNTDELHYTRSPIDL